MTNAENTISVIEFLRTKMIGLAEETGSLLNQDVIRVSQQLDLHLVQLHLLEEQPIPTERSETNWWPPEAAGNETHFFSWKLSAKTRRHLHVIGLHNHR
ncbi:Spo0E family sporulation regulatory protein-aspartic acid phosphatase [Alicyclobacillus fodiniaquatilis]|jgi:hypothetical protein|uniref:Spo0E family sporulation regulatory protein-aspartic acid phosphatase n=1 Tax=Alicyclobacillus fodiniaquatilis TaxID=1661150 RepID=A0ABW4JPP1_9BACL